MFLFIRLLALFLLSANVIKASSLMDAYSIAQKSAEFETMRINIIAENIANIENVNYNGTLNPYIRKQLILTKSDKNQVKAKVLYNKSAVKLIFNPNHPLANKNGYVAVPNIEIDIEKVDLIKAKQLYDINLSVMELTKSMIKDTLSNI